MDLFDLIEKDIAQENPANCKHVKEEPTETDWGPPYGVRMTWTCKACGRVRGRC